MSTKSLVRMIAGAAFAIVVAVPLLYFRWGIFPYIFVKQAFFQAAVEAMFAAWLVLAAFEPRYRPRFTPLLWALAAFSALLLLTSFTGVDWWRSLWSTYERQIGAAALLHFAAFGFVLSSLAADMPWKKLFYSSVAVSAAVSVIGFMQLASPQLLLIENPGSRPGSTFGNPTFLTGYLIFHVFLALYLFFDSARGRRPGSVWAKPAPWFLIGSVAVNLIAIALGQTRADILALTAGFLVLLVFFALRPPEAPVRFLASRKFYAGCLAAIALFAVVFAATFRAPMWQRVPGLARFRSISLSFQSPSIGPRLYALRAAWKGFLERPWLGWGPENFTMVSNKYYDPGELEFGYTETRTDEPHNFFLGYLVGGGIPLALALLGVFGAAAYETLRVRDDLWRPFALAALAAYFVGELFIFETIGPLLMLYLFFAYTDGAFRARAGSERRQEAPRPGDAGAGRAPGWAAAVIGAAVALAAYAFNVQSVAASYYQYEGFQSFLRQDISSGIGYFREALAVWNPYRWNFARDYAVAVIGQYFDRPGTVSDQDALDALRAMERVRDEHPLDAYNHYALVNLYNEVSSIDPGKFLPLAEAEASSALALSPGRQEVYFLLAKTKVLEGDKVGALAVLRRALDEDPKVADAHFYYGLVAYDMGDAAAGYRELETAIQMGRPWSNANEPKAVANFFADSGHLDEALKLYELAYGMSDRSDLDAEAKIGLIYFSKGDAADARTYLADVASRMDLTKSPSYRSLKPILDALGIKTGQ